MAIPPKQSQAGVKNSSALISSVHSNGDNSRLRTYLESLEVAQCAIFYFSAGMGIQEARSMVPIVPMWFLSPVIMNQLK